MSAPPKPLPPGFLEDLRRLRRSAAENGYHDIAMALEHAEHMTRIKPLPKAERWDTSRSHRPPDDPIE